MHRRGIIVFRREHHHAHSAGVNSNGGTVASCRPFYMQNKQDDSDGVNDDVIVVSNFPAGMMQEELSEGIYTTWEVQGIRDAYVSVSFTSSFLSFPTCQIFVRTWFEIQVFCVFERQSCRKHFACPQVCSDHLLGPILAHRTYQEQTVWFAD